MQFYNIFEKQICYDIGNKARIKFWTDKWVCEDTLQNKISQLFDAVRSKNLMGNQVIRRSQEDCIWDIIPRRRLNDCEINQAVELCTLLATISLKEEEDNRVWEENQEKFSANRVLKMLSEQRCMGEQLVIEGFPFKQVQFSPFVLPKVGFFIFRILHRSVLTIENLKKRGLHLVNRRDCVRKKKNRWITCL